MVYLLNRGSESNRFQLLRPMAPKRQQRKGHTRILKILKIIYKIGKQTSTNVTVTKVRDVE